MKIVIGCEGGGRWGKETVEYLLKKIKYTNVIFSNKKDCDIILGSNWISCENWNREKKPYILWSGESYKPRVPQYASKTLYILTSYVENTIYVPYFISSPYFLKPKKYNTSNRKYVLAYCSSNRVKIREDLFNSFVSKTSVSKCHSFGRNYGKYPITNKRIKGDWKDSKLIDAYKDYTFVVAMENKIKDGYITEKILNAFYSGAIPIYWGSKSVTKFFNKNAFIKVNDFKSVDECVSFVLSMTPQQIKQMQNEPIYRKDNDIINLFNPKTFNENNKTFIRYKHLLESFLKK